MTDTTLDVLLEAVRFLLCRIRRYNDSKDHDDYWLLRDKLDALIAQRKGRPDDQPAK